MKNLWFRRAAIVAVCLGMNSCFSNRQMYNFFGYLTVQGLPYAGPSLGGDLDYQEFGDGALIGAHSTSSLPGLAGVYTGTIDGFQMGITYTRQSTFRLEANAAGVELRDIGGDGRGNLVGVGSEGSIVTFDDEDCLRFLDSGTSENLNAISHIPSLDRWIAAGDNNTILASQDRLIWDLVPNPLAPAMTHYTDSIAYEQGGAFMSDGGIAEVTRGLTGGLQVGYITAFRKKYEALAALGPYYYAMGEDTDGGGTVIQKRTEFNIEFDPNFNSAYGSQYFDFFAYRDLFYFIRDESGPDYLSVIEIRNASNGEIVSEYQSPIIAKEAHFTDEFLYFYGLNAFGEGHLLRAELDGSQQMWLTEQPENVQVKAAECLDGSGIPTWSIYKCWPGQETDGASVTRYRGNETWDETIEGTVGSGAIQATYRVSSKLSLGVGWEGSGPLLIADDGERAWKLGLSRVSGRLNSILVGGNTAFVTNEDGDVYSATIPANPSAADFGDLTWGMEALPYEVEGHTATMSSDRVFYAIKGGGGTSDEIAMRLSNGSWSSIELNFADKINGLYYDPGMLKLFVASGKGLGYRTDAGVQGLLPIQVNNKSSLVCHHIVGDGAGYLQHAVFGDQEQPEEPCTKVELGYYGMATSNPTVDVLGYVVPSQNPKLHYSAGFFACMGNRNYFALRPRIFRSWSDYAGLFLGDPNADPDGDLDANGVADYVQAVAGPKGFRAYASIPAAGLTNYHLPLHSSLPDHQIIPEESTGLGSYERFGGVVVPNGDASLDYYTPQNGRSFFRATIQRTF